MSSSIDISAYTVPVVISTETDETYVSMQISSDSALDADVIVKFQQSNNDQLIDVAGTTNTILAGANTVLIETFDFTTSTLYLHVDVGSATLGTLSISDSGKKKDSTTIEEPIDVDVVSGGSIPNIISAANSSTSILTASATFTGGWEDVTLYNVIGVTILTGNVTDGTLYFDLSMDGGTNYVSIPRPITDTTFNLPHKIAREESHARIRYINGTTSQTGFFNFQTVYSNNHMLGLNYKIDEAITDDYEATLVKNVNVGKNPDGTYVNEVATGTVSSATTTTPLGIAGTFDSGCIVVNGHSQIETTLLSDVDGVLVGSWYNDSACTDLVRTFTRPYTGGEGFAYFSAPRFAEYFNYTYTNGSVAQTDFSLSTRLLTGAVSPQILGLRDFLPSNVVGSVARIANSPEFDRNTGVLGGQEALRQFGSNTTVSTSFETIWNGAHLGGALNYTFPITAETLRIKAGGNAADDIAGAGARKVMICYLDSNWDIVEEVLDTAGASASAVTSSTAYRVLFAEVTEVGAYGGNNTGDIIIENTTALQELAYVSATIGKSESGFYTVPSGKTMYVLDIQPSISSTNKADVRLFSIANADDFTTPFTSVKKYEWGINEYGSTAGFKLDTFLKFEEKTDIIFDTKKVGGGGGTAQVSIEYDFILIDN
jgi:hypothetical protein